MDARLVVAIGVFLLGTMYLWSSPAFVKPADVRPGAPAWSGRFFAPEGDAAWRQGLLWTGLLVAALFAVAAFGLWRGAGTWWLWAGLAAALLGILALLPWWSAVGTHAPAMSVLVNALLLLWAVAVALAVLAPALRAQVLRLAGGG
jgi:hypothetical protein